MNSTIDTVKKSMECVSVSDIDSNVCKCEMKCYSRNCDGRCKYICEQVSNLLNSGFSFYSEKIRKLTNNFSEFHPNENIILAIHMWGYVIKPEMCPYKYRDNKKCFVWHVAKNHNDGGCIKEKNQPGSKCLFACTICFKKIRNTEAFEKHAKNHP